jgi:xylulokinase
LLSAQGNVLAGAAELTPLYILPGGGVEQDPADWWRAICTAVRRMFAAVSPAEAGGTAEELARRVRGICVTAQWAGTVPVDRAGAPLARALVWMDERGAPYIRRHIGGLPAIQGYGVRPLWSWVRRTGGVPSHSGKDSIAHILYLQCERPDIYARTYKFLEPKDYINCVLTGRCMATVESITLHWVTDNRNIHDIRYDDVLLRRAGIDRDKLPDLCRSTDVLGTLTAAAAADLGLPPSVEVVAGTPDLHSAAIGSGAVADYAPHCYIGTSAWLGCHVPFKKTDLLHNMASLPSAIPGRYLLINEQETAGACLTMLRDRIFFADDALGSGPFATSPAEPHNPAGSPAPADFFERLEAVACTAPPGSNRLIFTPWLHGERSPVDERTLRGGWHNLSLRTTRGDFVRSVYEGVAMNMRWLMQAVEGFIKRPLDSIHLVGGGARSALWCQIHADILQRPILRVADPVYTNARGAGFLAAMGLGCATLETLNSQMPIAAVHEPHAGNRALYDELFGEFREIYRKTHGIYARLNGLEHHA